MSVYVVTYDLMSPGQDYSDLHEKLRSFAYSKNFDSFWLIDTSLSAAQIRDELKSLTDSNDKLFIIEVKKHWASSNIPQGMVDWLKSEKRTFS